MSSTTTPQASQAPAPHDPFYLIAESTAAEVGGEFLAALVRSMHEAMDVSVAVITRGIGEPPVRARAAFSWKKAGSAFPDEYDLEGTPCSVVYKGQHLVLPEQLWRRFPREAGKEGYCGVPLRNSAGKVVWGISRCSPMSPSAIRSAPRASCASSACAWRRSCSASTRSRSAPR